ncbi:MAG TPA: alpha-1,4-glucan--maltose-1-phosphate maltosyltransferase [Methylibium sp.]|uniref:alpha-1,4-glucan--maltose-1-phosphate maltosyltransferase n=1 Tax=Methylibium sp. TaxID=2067992 RepID=UPI002DBDB35F|nr:alpha-1,4-glucan--maltose-1-phosphate maltosyltransferase [Methylibium sp.]HEU4460347.1 alpha-1,4-glucan--maltose-1-phosphate maltosyltransferase [Methylibium sp.]
MAKGRAGTAGTPANDREAHTAEARPPGIVPPGLEDGRSRAVIDAVMPVIDGGRFAVKCIAGEPFEVQAHGFTDGHDKPRLVLRWWAEGGEGAEAADAREVEMTPAFNDEWSAAFTPPVPGRYCYQVIAWVDHWRSWRAELLRRVEPADIRVAARVGVELIDAAAGRVGPEEKAERKLLKDAAAKLKKAAAAKAMDAEALKAQALDDALDALVDRHPDRSLAVRSEALPLQADRLRARFSTWYELFPRSASDEPGRHGTLADVEARLPYVARLGCDVLYLPPIHPIGRDKRKGRNNAVSAEPGDVGSPWAIGAEEGGHKSVLPELGTVEDLRRLCARAAEHGIEIALDIAFQCAPDHPYVKQHPQWFRWRPDGSVQYAENPPKKYQDIYPFNFECDDWRALWAELKSIFDFWIAQGVQIFRVDNPHTKSFAFWEWAIGAIRREHPQVIFLAEAFTRPKVMHRLAKLGYSQSYTYFTWRHTRRELVEYFTELAQGPGRHHFRPNVWPNTPDILNEQLHHASRETFALRLVLAATLASNYGFYGPAFELMENTPREPGSEEYRDSEKYQLRSWELDRADSLAPLIAHVNRIRRAHPALQSMDGLRFHGCDNPQLIVYSKRCGDDVLLTVVNLDPHATQSGWLQLDVAALGIAHDTEYQMHDLLTEQRFAWRGGSAFVILDPRHTPAHVMQLRARRRSEHGFDYYEG